MAENKKPRYLHADYISNDFLIKFEDTLDHAFTAIDLPSYELEEDFKEKLKTKAQEIIDELDKEMLSFGDFSIDEFKGSREGQGWKSEN